MKMLYQFVRILCSAINKHNKDLQHASKELIISENTLSKQLSTIDFYILNRSITLHYNKFLEKPLHTQQQKLSSLKRSSSLPTFTANKTINNLTQSDLSQEESDLIKAGLHFSIRPNKIWKSKIFTTFEKIYRSFMNNLKSEETKSQMRVYL